MSLTKEEIDKRVSDSYELPNNVLLAVPQPLVTIRTSTYQHAPYIKDCIEGVLNQQTTFPIEFIIGEDYSTDGTREIVFKYAQKYPDLIRVITADYNVGSKANGKRCRNASRAKYIAQCEGDDYWIDPYKLQKQVDFLESNEDFVLCSHHIDRVDANKNILKQVSLPEKNLFFSKGDMFHEQHARFSNLSLVHRNVDLIYDEILLNTFNGDAVKVALLSSHGKAAQLNFVGGVYRIHQGGAHSRNSYLANMKKSIRTRQMMYQSTCFDDEQKEEIRKEIHIRKRKGIKFALKRFKFFSAFAFARL